MLHTYGLQKVKECFTSSASSGKVRHPNIKILNSLSEFHANSKVTLHVRGLHCKGKTALLSLTFQKSKVPKQVGIFTNSKTRYILKIALKLDHCAKILTYSNAFQMIGEYNAKDYNRPVLPEV
jgi:hypothetical protein